MNHAELKNYAPQARRDFIQAVTDRAAFYGVTSANIKPVTQKGDVAIIAGHAFPASVVAKRKKLEGRINRYGFNQTMEALAYTWFNRFVAIRFMEIHGYLEHGYRVLSHPDPIKTIPEILELAEHIDLPGLNKEKVIDLKLEGNKESELYRMLLLAQCHALHSAMPFLFEGIDDETELVLPENLLHSDSIIQKLVAASDPEDWQEVEVLGWLYQFYISERKDEVMARKSAVPTEDIPAVTQLFTPHWIVRYLVENSLGRLWLLNHPGSRLREHMPYYIEGEAETDFLKITKPEEIRLLDPACGSGHMLTYAFDLLFLIYEEEGYVPSEIPALILRHNLYGLEICPRATQIANLAVVFKAREKSHRFIQPGNLIQPHIRALQNVHFDDRELSDYIAALDLGDLFTEPTLRLLHQFEEATTFGSLIQPCLNETAIAYARQAIEAKDLGGQLFLRETHGKVLLVLEQAEMLCQRYHVVVANPPYMGGKGMNSSLKTFLADEYPDYKSDLYAAFIVRGLGMAVKEGFLGFMTPFTWMFIGSYEHLRNALLTRATITSLVQLEYSGFDGATVPICTFTLQNGTHSKARGGYIRLSDFRGSENQGPKALEAIADPFCGWFFRASGNDFQAVPGSPIAYWISDSLRNAFAERRTIGDDFIVRGGMTTGDNLRFLRLWHEVGLNRVGLGMLSREDARISGKKWFPYNKGGEFRKWFGNNFFVVNWESDGAEILGSGRASPRSKDLYFKPSLTWTDISSGEFGIRESTAGFLFDASGPSIFNDNPSLLKGLLSFLCSRVSSEILKLLNSSFHVQAGDISRVPWDAVVASDAVIARVNASIDLAHTDWDNFETSWDFRDLPLLRAGIKGATLAASWETWRDQCATAICRMQELETENNRLFIDAYGLADELNPEVPDEQIILARADQRKDLAAFLSYAVGCMVGRYSLDKPGLILADGGDSLDEYLAKVGQPLDQLTFAPDANGIIPVLDGEWFENDIVTGTRDFLRATFGEATLEANIRFIEEAVGKDLRKYFLTDFYKDHLQTYKKRPIYWLFSSGKERAFQALVYLHRYQEGTLSRMRTEYVIPLQGKIASRIDQLAEDIQKATSTSHLKKMQKERDSLLKQRTELQAFDEKLRHYADQRIQLDLDDGVKVNYGKFGDLLAEVKAVTGGSDD
jgi:type II restriction/modification system DNA methylase subunit YeeA